jgi:aspartate/tyrosine/aromatic aminotransferase
MTRRRTNTQGHQFVNALVAKETYDFLAQYRGMFSFGVGLDSLVAEVRKLRQQVEILRKAAVAAANKDRIGAT